MAFGFPPSHSHTFSLENTDGLTFLTRAVEAATLLNWEISFLNQSGFTAHTSFSMSSWSEQIDLVVGEQEAILVSTCTGGQLLDWGKNKNNIEQFKNSIKEVDLHFPAEELREKSALIRTKFSPERLSQQTAVNIGQRFPFLSMFIPGGKYVVTPIILGITILIFILMALAGVGLFKPDGQSLVDWGASFRPAILRGEWWRLITSCFIHIGLFHLLLNMYALVYVGLILEPCLGSARFLAVYLATGLFASGCSLWWHDYAVSAGASGAIFGLYGVFLALLTTDVLHDSVKRSFLVSTAFFIIYNLLNGFRPDSGIDNAAHIGGLVSGLVAGYLMVPSLRRSGNTVISACTLLVIMLLSIGGCLYIYKLIPNDYNRYDAEMLRFSELEEKSLRIFHLPDNSSADLLLKKINEESLPGWNENLRIISGLEKLNLPLNLRAHNERLKKYCELRIHHFELLARAITENSDIYEKELTESNDAIDAIIAELSEQ